MLVSVVWIMFSDKWLALFVPNQEAYVVAQTIKGWFFVLASSLLLYVLIKQGVDDLVDQLEENYQQSRKLEAVLRGIGDAVFVTDERKRILMVNEAMEKLSGFKEKELVGTVYSEKLCFVSEETGKKLFSAPRSVYVGSKEVKPKEPGVLIRKNGERVAIDGVGSPYKDSSGRVLGGVGVVRDVSKERDLDKMKSDFVSLASHQLRSPLTGIKWIVELLLESIEKMSKSEVANYVKKIEGSNQKLIDLVNDLLSVSRIESGKMKQAEKIVSLNLKELLLESIEEVRLLLKEKKSKIVGISVVDDKIVLRGDKTQLVQIFANLLNNAVKFSANKSEVRIKVNKDDSWVNITIEDSGVGIPKKEVGKLFGKFFRGTNVAKHISGSGLGLYVVKRLLETQGGKIRIESIERKGTKVYVGLPIMYNKK